MAKIEVSSKPLFQAGNNVNIQHMYILYTNDLGERYSLRGGPKGSDLKGALFGDIQVVDVPYVKGFIDFDEFGTHVPPHLLWSGTDAEMQPLLLAMRQEMNRINSEGYDYNLPMLETALPGTPWERLNKQNSNTVAYHLAQAAGLETNVETFVRINNLDTPGYHSPLEHSIFEKTTDSLSQAIKDSGTTFSKFMFDIGYKITPQALSWGDPHLVTLTASNMTSNPQENSSSLNPPTPPNPTLSKPATNPGTKTGKSPSTLPLQQNSTTQNSAFTSRRAASLAILHTECMLNANECKTLFLENLV